MKIDRTTVHFTEHDKNLIKKIKDLYGINSTIGVIRYALRVVLFQGKGAEVKCSNEREQSHDS